MWYRVGRVTHRLVHCPTEGGVGSNERLQEGVQSSVDVVLIVEPSQINIRESGEEIAYSFKSEDLLRARGKARR